MQAKKILSRERSSIPNEKSFERFTVKNVLYAALISAAVIGWFAGLMELREDHVYLLLVCLIAYFASDFTRKLFFGFLFILLYWIVYDSLRVYPNYMINPVHIIEPYNLEKSLFGVVDNGELLTLNEYFAIYNNTFLDVISGAFYLSWVPVPLVIALYLFFNDRSMMLQFMLAFFIVNLIAMSIYYLYPAAPPWYYEIYGTAQNFNIPGSAARLLKFDEFFGIELFKDMYDKNGSVFAAIPSMHSAFPVLTFYFALKYGMKKVAPFLFLNILGIWFAAVYSNHHYFIDVVYGGLCAGVTILFIEGLLRSRGRKWFDLYLTLLTTNDSKK